MMMLFMKFFLVCDRVGLRLMVCCLLGVLFLLLVVVIWVSVLLDVLLVYFDWFEYRGDDQVFEVLLLVGYYCNFVLVGFYVDFSIVCVNGWFYLVNFSFIYFLGILVFESVDLVYWKQIGNVIDCFMQLDFDGLSVLCGIFVFIIEYYDGIFYVVIIVIDSGGNFIVIVCDLVGLWFDLYWLFGIDGIDLLLFFDDDGKVYLINNDVLFGLLCYDGYCVIWMQQIDLVVFKLVGFCWVLVDGGVELVKNLIWIEGLYIYKWEGWYYLFDVEGGIGLQYLQVVLCSCVVWGFYVFYVGNLILIQCELLDDCLFLIINVGYVDLVEGLDGLWWVVFLVSCNYQKCYYNIGCEIYLLLVCWQDGWLQILLIDQVIFYVVKVLLWMQGEVLQVLLIGNFVVCDNFDGLMFDCQWLCVCVFRYVWVDLYKCFGMLVVYLFVENLDMLCNLVFFGWCQQYLCFEVSIVMILFVFGVVVGLVVFQSEVYWYFFGVCDFGGGCFLFFFEVCDGGGSMWMLVSYVVLMFVVVCLKIVGNEGDYVFLFDIGDGQGW